MGANSSKQQNSCQSSTQNTEYVSGSSSVPSQAQTSSKCDFCCCFTGEASNDSVETNTESSNVEPCVAVPKPAEELNPIRQQTEKISYERLKHLSSLETDNVLSALTQVDMEALTLRLKSKLSDEYIVVILKLLANISQTDAREGEKFIGILVEEHYFIQLRLYVLSHRVDTITRQVADFWKYILYYIKSPYMNSSLRFVEMLPVIRGLALAFGVVALHDLETINLNRNTANEVKNGIIELCETHIRFMHGVMDCQQRCKPSREKSTSIVKANHDKGNELVNECIGHTETSNNLVREPQQSFSDFVTKRKIESVEEQKEERLEKVEGIPSRSKTNENSHFVREQNRTTNDSRTIGIYRVNVEKINVLPTTKKIEKGTLSLNYKKIPDCSTSNKHFNSVYDVNKNISLDDPQDDYRKLSVYPTSDEVADKTKSFVRENIVEGPYKNVNHYLDTHFRLLREYFVASVRNGVNNDYDTVRIYDRVQLLYNIVVKNQIGVAVRFENSDDGKLKFDNRFLHGGLLCFTNDDYESFIFATIIERREEDLEKGIVVVHFEQEFILNSYYVMIECIVHFDPFYHVLKALQDMSQVHFPMQRYIIEVNKDIKPPKYLSTNPEIEIAGRIVNVLNPSEWPTKEALDLNQSQYEAFWTALTNEFHLIQGPPGTGKTFLGLKILQTLLKANRTPILILSYTNDAVDQLLEGLLPYTTKLMRVGGQSRSDVLKPYNIAKKRMELFARKKRVDDVELLKTMEIIGMTTTCAARLRRTLLALRCRIILVDNCAETLEAHVIAGLTSSCEHLILIGRQLQPSIAYEKFGSNMNVEVSLFERMLRNNCKCSTLNVQNHMKLQITNSSYKELYDHENILRYSSVVGVVKSFYFIDHDEISLDNTKQNKHEATFLINLARYLLLNGYEGSDITILTTYIEQKDLIEEEQKRHFDLPQMKRVKVTVADGYCEKFCKIVLLSLVKNNENRSIGFLDDPNRLCFILSRATIGLYIMGNIRLLSHTHNSVIWKRKNEILVKQKNIGNSLKLRCTIHNKETDVETAEDFIKVSKGGCDQYCNENLFCGHKCVSVCHLDNKDHKNYKCLKMCKKLLCQNSTHICCKLCFQCKGNCGPCEYPITRTFPCGHNEELPCFANYKRYKCRNC